MIIMTVYCDRAAMSKQTLKKRRTFCADREINGKMRVMKIIDLIAVNHLSNNDAKKE